MGSVMGRFVGTFTVSIANIFVDNFSIFRAVSPAVSQTSSWAFLGIFVGIFAVLWAVLQVYG